MAMIPFVEWRPDMPALSQWAREALNVVPAEESYRPLNSLVSTSNALSARAQGAAWFRAVSGGTQMFAGDGSKLYSLSPSATAWADASRVSGGAYAPGDDGFWRFTQFGTLAIAVDGVDVPQKFDLASGSKFEALGGSPSAASYIATVRDFVVLGKMGNNRQRVQWSALNNCESWGISASTQADIQDLPDGGNVTGLVGGEVGVIFQETAIRRMTYEGAPVVFRIDKIVNDIGCSVPNSVAGFIDMAFFLHKSGFYVLKAAQQVVPIGRGKVDKTFWSEFDETNLHRTSSALDSVRGLYFFAYPANGSNGTPNRLLIYNWATERWARAAITCDIIFGGASSHAYTLEELDSFGTLEDLPYSLDSSYWSGVLSLLMFGFDTDHKSGSFSGTTLAATVETAEFNPGKPGMRSVIRGVRPLVDGGKPQTMIGARETQQQAAINYGPAVGLTPAGMAPVYSSGRYFRVRTTMGAGETWNNMIGIDDLDVRPAGAQ